MRRWTNTIFYAAMPMPKALLTRICLPRVVPNKPRPMPQISLCFSCRINPSSLVLATLDLCSASCIINTLIVKLHLPSQQEPPETAETAETGFSVGGSQASW
ncbi:hypothetical protein V2G26_003985 [Clonostachys chloroleuca]